MAIKGNNIFAGTDWGGGVILSTDNGKSWTHYNSGLEDSTIYSLAISHHYIFAGTKYYGIYRAKLSDFGITNIKDEPQNNNSINIFPNPASDFIEINSSIPFERIEIYNSMGENVSGLNFRSLPNFGSFGQKINVTALPSGLYFCGVTQGKERKILGFIKE